MSKTVLITGANGNLGRAVVEAFLDEGWKVYGIDRKKDALQTFRGNSNFNEKVADLLNEEECQELVEEIIRESNSIEAGLFLAGGFSMGSIGESGLDDIYSMIRLNFNTAYGPARPLFNHMMENGYGRLVFVGARPVLRPKEAVSKAGYALSKSLLFHLAEILNAAAGMKNVVSSVIVPSTIDTKENRLSMPDSDPSRWVKTGDIAAILKGLCGDTGSPLRETVLKIYGGV